MTDESKKTALVISDDQDVQNAVTSSGFETMIPSPKTSVMDLMRQSGLPDLVVVDQRLPSSRSVDLEDMDWLWSGIGVIVISEDYSNPAAVEALRWADDYVRWPLGSGELAMRMQRVSSRLQPLEGADGPIIRIGPGSVVNLVERWSNVDGTHFKLTPTEAALIHVLLRFRGVMVAHETLVTRVWGIEQRSGPETWNSLRVHMHRLRKKLERDADNPEFILTDRGGGYKLAALS